MYDNSRYPVGKPMSLCINPQCQKIENPEHFLFCEFCGSELLLQGRYRVMRKLEDNGFAVKYEINDVKSNTPKILKVLIDNSNKAVELFQQEVQVLSHINHPGIPKVERDGEFVYFPKDSHNSIHCLIVEKVVGMDLQTYMENREMRPIDETLAMQWLKEIVAILQQVHSQNFFPGDIQPHNIILQPNGQLALIDFGTARALTFAQAQNQVTQSFYTDYTPREQMKDQTVPQSNFLALGHTFVYMLTGKELSDKQIDDSENNELGWRYYAPDVSPQMADLIDKMVTNLPSQQLANTQEILQRLAEMDQAFNPLQPISTPTQPINRIIAAPPAEPVITPEGTASSTLVTKTTTIIERGFYLQWLLATTVGTIAGYGVSYPLDNAVSFAVVVTSIGIMQWLVLRLQIYQVGSWVLATTLGYGVGYGMSYALHGTVLFAVVGTSIGIMQWLVLRLQIYQAGWWILVNGVGSAVLGAVLSVNNSMFVFFAAIIVIFGLIAGLVMDWLLQNPISPP